MNTTVTPASLRTVAIVIAAALALVVVGFMFSAAAGPTSSGDVDRGGGAHYSLPPR